MDKSIIWKDIKKDSHLIIKTPYKLCEKCNKEYTCDNVFASRYCKECADQIKKEKTRERVRRYREHQKHNA